MMSLYDHKWDYHVHDVWSNFRETLGNIINSLWPSGAIWRHRSKSTLVQIASIRVNFRSVEWHIFGGNLK